MVARSLRLLYQMPTDHKMKSDSFMVEMSGRFQPCQVLTRAACHGEGPASLLWDPCSKWVVSLHTDADRLKDYHQETTMLFEVKGNWEEISQDPRLRERGRV